MKKILLTGATGFLGSHLLAKFVENKYNIVILKRSTSETKKIEHLLSSVTTYDVDVTGIETVFKKHSFDLVIHTACAYGRAGEPLSNLLKTNILFGIKLLEQAILAGTPAFINTDTFFNSDKFTHNYLKSYTLTKKHFRDWLLNVEEGIQIINLKLHHMYGPGDAGTKFIPWVTGQLLDNVDHIDLTSGVQKRDFIYVSDVVNAFQSVIEYKDSLHGIFNELEVGTGTSVSIHDFVETVKETIQEAEPATITMLNFGVVKNQANEIPDIQCDNSALKSIGWTPLYTVQTGCKEMIREIMKQ